MGFFNEYPSTNFHELNADWILAEVQQLIKDWSQTESAWNALREDNTEFKQTTEATVQSLQNFVNTYFDNLDVQNEINTKLTAMVNDGTLSQLIAPYIQAQSSPIVVTSTSDMTDNTKIYVLATNGVMYYYNGSQFVASSVVYGDLDKITTLSSLVDYYKKYLNVNNLVEIVQGKYVTYDDSGLLIVNVANSGYVKIECKFDTRIVYSTTTPNTPLTMCLICTDEDGNILSYINNGVSNNAGVFAVPHNAKYIYFNFNATASYPPVYLTELEHNNISLLKCACFGDSITWYDGHRYNWGKEEGTIAIGYESYLRQTLGMTVDNYGLSGHTMPMIAERAILHPSDWDNPVPDFASYDYITISSGANDERNNTPLGSIQPIGSDYNVNTFIGALQKSIDHILSINKNVKILLCTPIMGWIYAPNGYEYPRTEDGIVTDKWAKAIKDVANLYSLPVCDWYYESGINLWTRINYINDPEPVTHGGDNDLYSLHPTTAGFKRMADILMSKILDI